MFCSPILLCFLTRITESILLTEGRMLVSPALPNGAD